MHTTEPKAKHAFSALKIGTIFAFRESPIETTGASVFVHALLTPLDSVIAKIVYKVRPSAYGCA